MALHLYDSGADAIDSLALACTKPQLAKVETARVSPTLWQDAPTSVDCIGLDLCWSGCCALPVSVCPPIGVNCPHTYITAGLMWLISFALASPNKRSFSPNKRSFWCRADKTLSTNAPAELIYLIPFVLASPTVRPAPALHGWIGLCLCSLPPLALISLHLDVFKGWGGVESLKALPVRAPQSINLHKQTIIRKCKTYTVMWIFGLTFQASENRRFAVQMGTRNAIVLKGQVHDKG